MPIRMARVYDATDGHRVLVDRLWPRGVAKADAPWDEWRKDLAPSTGLRRAVHDGTLSFPAFKAAYLDELDAHPGPPLRVTPELVLVTAAKVPEESHVAVLAEWLAGRG